MPRPLASKIAIENTKTNVIKLIWKTRICCTSHTHIHIEGRAFTVTKCQGHFCTQNRIYKAGAHGKGRGRVKAGPKTKPKLKTFELNSRSNVYVDEGLCHCVPQQQQQHEQVAKGKPQTHREKGEWGVGRVVKSRAVKPIAALENSNFLLKLHMKLFSTQFGNRCHVKNGNEKHYYYYYYYAYIYIYVYACVCREKWSESLRLGKCFVIENTLNLNQICSCWSCFRDVYVYEYIYIYI